MRRSLYRLLAGQPYRLIYLSLFALCLAACVARPASFMRPNGVAPLPDGSLYVMDFGNYRIVHISAEGRELDAFGKLGVGPNDIFFGWDMATDLAGNIYFCNRIDNEADTVHDGIKVFSPAGDLVREIGAVDYDYDAPRSYSPYGLDIDNAGRVYTADFGTGTVRVFDGQGRPLAELFGEEGDGAGQFNGLSDVAVDDGRGWLYASDNVNSRVQQFALAFDGSGGVTATYAGAFGSYGRDPGQFAYPQNLAVDETTGRLYVGDIANRRIQIFDAGGSYLSAIAMPAGVNDWQVMGLNVGPAGQLYVADALNETVWVFDAQGRLQNTVGGPP